MKIGCSPIRLGVCTAVVAAAAAVGLAAAQRAAAQVAGYIDVDADAYCTDAVAHLAESRGCSTAPTAPRGCSAVA